MQGPPRKVLRDSINNVAACYKHTNTQLTESNNAAGKLDEIDSLLNKFT